jgi:hypothetical protein
MVNWKKVSHIPEDRQRDGVIAHWTMTVQVGGVIILPALRAGSQRG